MPKASGRDGTVYAGYTQRSFWQMYNTQASRPFRETNYEPEVWYQYPIDFDLLGWRLTPEFDSSELKKSIFDLSPT